MDAQAQALWNARNIVGLLEYLNGQWTRMLMPMLEDLNRVGFNPVIASKDYETAWNQAAISRPRMYLAGLTVIHKLGQLHTWTEFREANARYFAGVPSQDTAEMRMFWSTGAIPGKAGAPGNVHLSPGDQWFVTDLSAKSATTTIGIGWSWLEGTITFEKYRVDDEPGPNDTPEQAQARAEAIARTKQNREISVTRKISLAGPAVGVSWNGAADIGKRIAGKLPSLSYLLSKPNADIAADFLTRNGPATLRTRLQNGIKNKFVETVLGMPGSTSVARAEWPARTVGIVLSLTGRPLLATDLHGHVNAISGGSAIGALAGISANTYILGIGPLPDDATRWVAAVIVFSGGVTAMLPTLSGGASLLIGEVG